MLIEFSITNFLSFYEKQTFSLVASKSKELEETHTFSVQSKAKQPRLLHAAAIYGANAAGKSNLLAAMRVMREIILSSAKESQVGEPIQGIQAHALHKKEATEFEIVFFKEGIRYQYGFAVTAQRVLEEWLFVFETSRAQQWLSRVYNPDSKKYEWLINATYIKGNKEVLKETTRDNALFISTAAMLNSKPFENIIEWFQMNLQIDKTENFSPQKTIEFCETPEGKEKIIKFLQTADISINAIQLKEENFSIDMLPMEIPQDIKEKLLQKIITEFKQSPKVHILSFIHKTEDGNFFELPLDSESRGTKNLFEIAGVWLNILEQGRVICIDELESSLHPSITRFLIELFHNPEINTSHAQLIFTTHNTTLLDTDLLRRDQIWFAEKDAMQTSKVYPLSDFSPRKDESLQKGYLQGRYGALPFISSPKWIKK